MPDGALLWQILVASLPRAAEGTPLGDALAAIIVEGERAWGPLDLDAARFVAYLAERLPPDLALEAGLAQLHGADLYLACGCALGDPRALRRFEERLMPALSGPLARIDRSPAFVDEARQRVRERLLVGEPGQSPKIASYTGQGPLAGWLRVAAVRTALTMRRRIKPDERAGAAGLDLRTTPADTELELLRRRHAADFEAAFRGALASLSVDDRNVVRLHYLDGLTVEQIASVYRTSRASAGRALVRVRAQILEEARRLLRERLKLTESELDSAIGALQSHLEVSLRALLS